MLGREAGDAGYRDGNEVARWDSRTYNLYRAYAYHLFECNGLNTRRER